MSAVYNINKGINRPIEFKGLKAQYIWWLGGGLAVLLLLFALLYILNVSMLICIVLAVCLSAGLFFVVYKISDRYGEHGFMKMLARKSVPKTIKVFSHKNLQNLLLNK